MGFSFSTIEPNQLGQVTKFDVPLNDWMGVKFSEGHSYTFGNQISEGTEDLIWDDNNPATPEVLNRAYGIEGRLKFDSPMSIQRARLIHERKRKELERLAYLESASHSWFSAKAAAGFGASLIGGLSHPVDLGLAFLPFIGSEKAAAQVAKMGGSAFRQSLARGIITSEEAFVAKGVPYARLTAGVIDGVLSQAVTEIPVAIQKHRNMADYTIADSVFNVVAGGAFAGALKGLGLAMERAAKLWKEADPRIRDAALMDTVNSIITGEEPKAHWAMGLDEATIRAKTEERIRGEQPFVEKGLDAVYPVGETLDFRWPEGGEAKGVVIGHTDTAIKLQVQGKEFPVFVREGDLIREVPRGIEEPAAPAEVRQAAADLGKAGKRLRRALRQEPSDVEAAREAMDDAEVTFWGVAQNAGIDQATFERFRQAATQTETSIAIREDATTQATRLESINDFNAKSKADYEQRIADQVNTETKRVMDEVRKQVPLLAPDVAKKHSFKAVPEDAQISALTEEIADIEASIMATARTPEEMTRLTERLKRIQAEAEELSGEPAIDKMLPCVAKRAE